jgi:hypothetical protein
MERCGPEPTGVAHIHLPRSTFSDAAFVKGFGAGPTGFPKWTLCATPGFIALSVINWIVGERPIVCVCACWAGVTRLLACAATHRARGAIFAG